MKAREFKNVSELREAKDSSNENYVQHNFNPRLDLIEYSAYEALEEKLKLAVDTLEVWKAMAEKLANRVGELCYCYSGKDCSVCKLHDEYKKLKGGE